MSVKVMSLVFDAQGLTPTEKLVLLSYADHAAEDGTRVYPSNARTAAKTGLTIRSVQRVTNKLIDDGIIVRVRDGGGHMANEHTIDTKKLSSMTHDRRSHVTDDHPRGDTESWGGVTDDHPRGDTESPLTVINHKNETSITSVSGKSKFIDAERVFRDVTGLLVMPNSDRKPGDIETICLMIDTHGEDETKKRLLYWWRWWQHKRTKSGRPYSKTNTAWIDMAATHESDERAPDEPVKGFVSNPDGSIYV